MTETVRVEVSGAAESAVAPAAESAVAPVRACAGWLALRREADVEARDRGASVLLGRLGERLAAAGTRALRIVDVGAGTGANRAYLEPRLHLLDRERALRETTLDRERALRETTPVLAQEWVAVDHDAELLAGAGHGDAVRVEAGVRELPDVLAGLAAAPPDMGLLLTCAALLDVLDEVELGRLADAIEGSGAPALLSLSVTGRVHWSPRDVRDAGLRRAFDAHQQRRGRPGPDAVRVLRDDLAARGLTVLTARTPWTLDARRPELLERWLTERVEAAVEQDPDEAEALHAWSARRRAQLASGRLSVRVDHEDLLVLPS